jgi:NADPH:quinone reductase-like Zn-dependent oxidoreductase
MKAFIICKYGQIDDVEQIEIECPGITDEDVLVKVKSAAINPADLKVITGTQGGSLSIRANPPWGWGMILVVLSLKNNTLMNQAGD